MGSYYLVILPSGSSSLSWQSKKKMIMRSFTSLVRPEIKGINPSKRETNANFRLIKLILLWKECFFTYKASFQINDNDKCYNWRIWGAKQPHEMYVWHPDRERVFWTSVWYCGSTFLFCRKHYLRKHLPRKIRIGSIPANWSTYPKRKVNYSYIPTGRDPSTFQS